MREGSSEETAKKWEGYCLDDGTGQNVYFTRADGFQSRQIPEGFEYELFKNGERRFYNRGNEMLLNGKRCTLDPLKS